MSFVLKGDSLFMKLIINGDFANNNIPSDVPGLLKEIGWVAVIGLGPLNVHLASGLQISYCLF